jgi:methyl-accepting chemotaxis protein
MRLLHDVPIKRKLTIIAMFTTTLALTLACATFTIYDQVVLRRDLIRDLSSTAEMIGLNSASALSFSDPGAAEETLKSLGAHRNVMAACVYGRDGGVFARYYRAGGEQRPFPTVAGAERAAFGLNRLVLVRRIHFDGEDIGAVYVRSDLGELVERLKLSAIIFVVVMLGAGLMSYLIVSRLQRVISDPVTHLAAVACKVAFESNYSVRAVKQGNDEVGALIDGFNEMLTLIQARDRKLQQAHDELEDRIDARTRELESSVSLLNATLDSTTDGIHARNSFASEQCRVRRRGRNAGARPGRVSRSDFRVADPEEHRWT